jgi:cytochrome c-type biogenesis protein CcmH
VKRTCALFVAALFVSPLSVAQAPSPANADPALEARVKALSAELRCLVCQNQTVADSDAPVARDMRDQVRAQLVAGKSESEVKHYMTERFGDFVLYKPPLKATTIVLWVAPFVALLLAVALLLRRLRGSERTANAPVLDDASRARARALLEGGRSE